MSEDRLVMFSFRSCKAIADLRYRICRFAAHRRVGTRNSLSPPKRAYGGGASCAGGFPPPPFSKADPGTALRLGLRFGLEQSKDLAGIRLGPVAQLAPHHGEVPGGQAADFGESGRNGGREEASPGFRRRFRRKRP